MENVFELGYVGQASGLLNYIKSFLPNCKICNDKGYYKKTEWTGTDTDYQVTVKCNCQDD